MLGLHSDGICIYGDSDTLRAQLKKQKLPLTGEVTGNTLVFSVDNAEIIQKRPYDISFSAVTTPWFVCARTQNIPHPLTLSFASDADIIAFITAVYYAAQEFLHLDIELSFLKQTLAKCGTLRAYDEAHFSEIPKNSKVIVFYFGNGGFLATDKLCQDLTKTYNLDMANITLAGSFASKKNLLVAFAAEK